MLISPLGEGVVNLVCSLIGARYLGAVGVALGTLIGAVAGVLLHFLNSMPRTDRLKFNRGEFATGGILRPVICCAAGFHDGDDRGSTTPQLDRAGGYDCRLRTPWRWRYSGK